MHSGIDTRRYCVARVLMLYAIYNVLKGRKNISRFVVAFYRRYRTVYLDVYSNCITYICDVGKMSI